MHCCDNEPEPYEIPRFTKDKIKQAFMKDGSWYIMKEDSSYIEFMKNGYKAEEGFWFCFMEENDEDCGNPYPVGEANLICMQPWVAVDTAGPEDYDNIQDMIDEANWCVEKYGKKYKI